MYIDHLKRGAGGILSHDEGCFGSQEGFCPFKNDLETTLQCAIMFIWISSIEGREWVEGMDIRIGGGENREDAEGRRDVKRM